VLQAPGLCAQRCAGPPEIQEFVKVQTRPPTKYPALRAVHRKPADDGGPARVLRRELRALGGEDFQPKGATDPSFRSSAASKYGSA